MEKKKWHCSAVTIMMYAAAWNDAFKFTKHGWTTNMKYIFIWNSYVP
jgi:hypothetical protein